MVVEKRKYRGEEIYVIELERWTSHAREWAGKVTGKSKKYGLALEFCPVVERKWSYSGKNGKTIVKLLGEGYYKISNPKSGEYGEKAIKYYYWDGKNNEMIKVDENEVYEKI